MPHHNPHPTQRLAGKRRLPSAHRRRSIPAKSSPRCSLNSPSRPQPALEHRAPFVFESSILPPSKAPIILVHRLRPGLYLLLGHGCIFLSAQTRKLKTRSAGNATRPHAMSMFFPSRATEIGPTLMQRPQIPFRSTYPATVLQTPQSLQVISRRRRRRPRDRGRLRMGGSSS